MCYNISTTNVTGLKSVAIQKNISYHYQSPSRCRLHWSYFATGNLGGLCFWDGDMGKRKMPEDYHNLAKERGFIWLGLEEVRTRHKTKWQCQKGHIWYTNYGHIQQGKGCPYCSGLAPKSIDDYCNIAKERGITWLGVNLPLTIKRMTLWQCSKGHEWEARFNNIQQGKGCPYCAGVFPKTVNDYHILAKERSFIWLGPEVPTVLTKTRWQCSKGHRWEAVYSSIQQGTGCPACSQSKGEEAILDFLNEYNITHVKEKKFDKCQDKGLLPFDFYFCLNQIHFLVEYDGIQHYKSIDYWGGDETLENCQRRDKIKDEFAKEYNFILIRIPYTVKNIKAYLQFELEKHLPFSLNQIKNQPQRPQPKIKPINPYQWSQGVLL